MSSHQLRSEPLLLDTHDYRPFNPETIWVSFVGGLLIVVAVGVYLWLGAGLAAIALVVLGCGILVYVLVVVWVNSSILIAIWTVTILSALSAVAILVLLGRRMFRGEAASSTDRRSPCRTYGNGPRQLHRRAERPCPLGYEDCEVPMVLRRRKEWPGGRFWVAPTIIPVDAHTRSDIRLEQRSAGSVSQIVNSEHRFGPGWGQALSRSQPAGKIGAEQVALAVVALVPHEELAACALAGRGARARGRPRRWRPRRRPASRCRSRLRERRRRSRGSPRRGPLGRCG